MTTSMPDAFELHGVRRAFRHFTLQDINLALPAGQIMGLVGPNGAGKSTTIRLLLGLIGADAGHIRVLGQPVPEKVAIAKREVAFVSDDMKLYGTATVAWHMQWIASLEPRWDAALAQRLLEAFELRPEQSVKGLSRGQHIKALLLLALARRPRLLVLDEPTSGLDPVARHELLTELMDIVRDEERSILFSSHNTADVERICDQIAFIDRGRLVDACDKESFLERWRRVEVEVPAGGLLPDLQGVVDLTLGERVAVLTTDCYAPGMHASIEQAGAKVCEIRRMSLEEIFVASVLRSRKESRS
jgi:ABC-2 type transport system ATP-binding protein